MVKKGHSKTCIRRGARQYAVVVLVRMYTGDSLTEENQELLIKNGLKRARVSTSYQV